MFLCFTFLFLFCQRTVHHVTSVFISRRDGERLAQLADNRLLGNNVTIAVKHVLSYRVVANRSALPPLSLMVTVAVIALLLGLFVVLIVCGVRKSRHRTSAAASSSSSAAYRNKNRSSSVSTVDVCWILPPCLWRDVDLKSGLTSTCGRSW